MVYNSKLQRLIEAECVDPKAVSKLKAEQLDAIEGLSDGEIQALIRARREVGKLTRFWWI